MLNIYYLRTYVKCLEFRDKKYSPDFLGTHGSGETVISTSNYNLVWHVLPWQEARRVETAGNAQEGHGNHFPEEKQEVGRAFQAEQAAWTHGLLLEPTRKSMRMRYKARKG